MPLFGVGEAPQDGKVGLQFAKIDRHFVSLSKTRSTPLETQNKYSMDQCDAKLDCAQLSIQLVQHCKYCSGLTIDNQWLRLQYSRVHSLCCRYSSTTFISLQIPVYTDNHSFIQLSAFPSFSICNKVSVTHLYETLFKHGSFYLPYYSVKSSYPLLNIWRFNNCREHQRACHVST
jgi:hypothetical protein